MFPTLRKLNATYLLYWRSQIVPFTWLMLVHFADQPPTPEDLFRRIFIQLAAYSALYVSLVIFWFAWLRRLDPKKSFPQIVIAVVSSGLVRGAFFTYLLISVGLQPESEFWFRVFASASNTAVSMLFGLLAVSAISDHNIERKKLLDEKSRLAYLHDVALPDVEAAHSRLVSQTKRHLSKIFSSFAQLSPDELREKLRNTIDEVVRPISYSIYAAKPRKLVLKTQHQDDNINWKVVLQNSTRPGALRPLTLGLSIAFAIVPAAVAKMGAYWAVAYVVTIAVCGIFWYWLAGLLIDPLLKRLGSVLRFVLVIAALIVTFLLIELTAEPVALLSPDPYYFTNFSPFFGVYSGVGITIGYATIKEAEVVRMKLASVTRDLAWDTARLRELQRQRQRNLARALHGSIQASLASNYLKMQKAGNRITTASKQKLSRELLAQLDKLDSTETHSISLREALDQVVSNWLAIAVIHIETSPLIGDDLATDPVCQTAIVDLIPELVFNAVKHGKAKHIFIAVRRLSQREIELEVSNDGEPLPKNLKLGLGSMQLDESSLEWSRKMDGGLVVTRAVIPFEG